MEKFKAFIEAFFNLFDLSRIWDAVITALKAGNPVRIIIALIGEFIVTH